MQKLLVILLVGFAAARISDDKCKEFYKLLPPKSRSLITKFPHMGLLGYSKDNDTFFTCSATLISESFVVAPAFCLTDHRGSPKHVLLGTDNLERKGDNYIILNVVETVIHPGYDKKNVLSPRNIALLRFSPPIIINDYIRTGCLYTKSIGDNETFTDLLWGRKAGNKILFKADSSIVPTTSCKKSYEKRATIDEKYNLCLQRTSFEGVQESHIGGTEHIKEDGIPKIAAFDIFGPRIPTPELPDVTTNVYSYLDWIEKNVWGQ